MALAGPDATQALALDAKALAGLKREAQADPRAAAAKAAGQFEALFLQMVLKQMRETLPKDGPFDTDTMRTYASMFDQQVAAQLASRGLGLREAIERQLARALPAQAGAAGPPAAAAIPAGGAKAAMSRAGAARAPPLPAHSPAGAASTPVAQHVQAFVERIRPHAQAAAAALGVPAHLLIAQAGLETGWGRSQPRHADGSASHNLFGVKATPSWRGASVAAATTEFVQGVAVRAVERFRAYASPGEAFADLARVLASPRYAGARASAQAADDAGYARNLQRAGYATDPQYADKLLQATRLVQRHLAAAPPPAVAAAGRAVPQDSPSAADSRNDRLAT